MKSRPALIASALLLLAGTHAGVYLLARGTGGAGEGNAELRETSYLPAKSADRGRNPSSPGGNGSSFRRLLRGLEQSGMPRADFEQARLALFREWIRRDLRGAMEFLFDPAAGGRYDGLRLELRAELEAEITREPREVWDWITTRRFGTKSRDAYTLWQDILIRAGQADVLLECVAGDRHFTSEGLVQQLCGRLPAARLAELRVLLDKAGGRNGLEFYRWSQPYAQRMAAEAGRDPMPFLAAEPDEKIRAQFLKEWADRELRYMPDAEAVAAVVALPEEADRGAAVRDLLSLRAGSGGPSGFAAMLNALEAQGLLGDPESEEALALCNSALMSTEHGRLTTVPDAYRALQGIRAEPLRHLALRELGDVHQSDGEVPYLECLASFPAGPDRDAFLLGIATSVLTEPAFRKKLLEAISDPLAAAEVRAVVEEEEGRNLIDDR